MVTQNLLLKYNSLKIKLVLDQTLCNKYMTEYIIFLADEQLLLKKYDFLY